jgi:hypothetical protein
VTLLYAIGVGAVVNVIVLIVSIVLRLSNVRLDWIAVPPALRAALSVSESPAIVIAVAAGTIVAALGIGARRELVRLALLGLATHAALVINRFLGVAFTGRATGDGSADAFLLTPEVLALLAVCLVLGIGVGLIVRGFRLRVRWWRLPERLVPAAGFAFVIGTVASVLWPAPFLAQLLAPTALAGAVLSLPLILAGPIAGGAYASRAGADYRGIALLGAYITLPVIVTLVVGTVADVGRLNDPRFDAFAGQLRGTIALSWFLVAMRLAGWPLGAAFVQGFLTPEASTRAEQAP